MTKIVVGNFIIDDIRGKNVGTYPIYMTLKKKLGMNLTFAMKKDEKVDEVYGFLTAYKKLREILPTYKISIENSTVTSSWSYAHPAYRVRIDLKIRGLTRTLHKIKKFFDIVEGLDTEYNVYIELTKDVEEEYNKRLVDLL